MWNIDITKEVSQCHCKRAGLRIHDFHWSWVRNSVYGKLFTAVLSLVRQLELLRWSFIDCMPISKVHWSNAMGEGERQRGSRIVTVVAGINSGDDCSEERNDVANDDRMTAMNKMQNLPLGLSHYFELQRHKCSVKLSFKAEFYLQKL